MRQGQSFRVLRWERSLARVDEVLEPRRRVPLAGQGDHWHFHRASELTFFEKGTGTRFVADHIEHFESGDLVMLGSNVPHYWHVRGESKGAAIQWHFPAEHGIWEFAEARSLKWLEEAARRGLHVRGPTAAAAWAQMQQVENSTGLARLSAFLGLLALLASAPLGDTRTLAARPFSIAGTAEHQEAVSRAVSYIAAHYRDGVHLKDLLRITSMSRATFARQFQRHAGKSFSAFLNQVRLQAVCRALRDTDQRIGSIALEHGFNNLSFFNRLFRREFGVPPNLHRTRFSSAGESPQMASVLGKRRGMSR